MRTCSLNPLPAVVAGMVLQSALTASFAAKADPVSWPDGFSVPQSTVSPDGRYGVLVPDAEHDVDRDGNRLVELATGKELAVIRAETGLEHMNHGGISPKWSPDGAGLLWTVGGKWCPRALVYLKLEDGKVAWQRELLHTAQQELLRRTRKAKPTAYAAAVKWNKGNGEAFPDDFTVDVNPVGEEARLPVRFLVALTSEPRWLPNMPAKAKLDSLLSGVFGQDGTIKWSGFKARANSWIDQCGATSVPKEWQDRFFARLRKEAPEAMAALSAHTAKRDSVPEWEFRTRGKYRAPDSFAMDVTVVFDSNPVPDAPGDPRWKVDTGFRWTPRCSPHGRAASTTMRKWCGGSSRC